MLQLNKFKIMPARPKNYRDMVFEESYKIRGCLMLNFKMNEFYKKVK